MHRIRNYSNPYCNLIASAVYAYTSGRPCDQSRFLKNCEDTTNRALPLLYATIEQSILVLSFGLLGEPYDSFEIVRKLNLPTYDFMGFERWSLTRLGAYLKEPTSLHISPETFISRVKPCAIDKELAYREFSVGLSGHARRCLQRAFYGRVSFGMLVSTQKEQLLELRGCGPRFVDELTRHLEQHGLRLGVVANDWHSV